MKLAFVFPGQGSQAVGMLGSFGHDAGVAATLREASTALGEDLARLIAEGPAAELDKTVNTQPCMLTASIAIYRAWRAAGGPEPEVLAGHSLGEYAALVAAGALTLQDGVPLVPSGTASCITRARYRTSGTPSCRVSAPAATSAAYSPRL